MTTMLEDLVSMQPCHSYIANLILFFQCVGTRETSYMTWKKITLPKQNANIESQKNIFCFFVFHSRSAKSSLRW